MEFFYESFCVHAKGKLTHTIKFLSIIAPNGLTANFLWPDREKAA